MEEKATQPPEDAKPLSSAEVQRTLHELRVHQIELEMQNEELRRAQEVLIQNNARRLTIIEEQAELICRYLPDGRLSFVNDAYARYYGKSRKELLDHNYIPQIPEPDISMVIERVKGITPDAPAAEFEHRVVMPDGEIRWQHWIHSAIFSCKTKTKIKEYQAAGHDVTERRRMEEALRESEAQYRTLFESAGDAIFIHDEQARILSANTTACERLGYTRAELMSMTVSQVDSPEHAPHAADRVARLMAQGHLFFETTHRRVDGSLIPTEVNARRITWNGQTATMSICRDISVREQTEKELRLKNLAFDLAISANSIADADGVIVDANTAFLRLWGYSGKEEVVGKPISLFFQNKEEAAAVIDILDMSGHYELEFTARRKDGTTFTAQGLAWIVRDENGELIGYQSSCVDITGHKRVEAELRCSEARLTLASRVVGLGTYAYYFETGVGEWSPEFKACLGLGAGDPVTLEADLLPACFHPEDRPRFLSAMTWANDPRSDGRLDVEYRVFWPDGSVRWLRACGLTEFVGEGERRRPWRATGGTMDITERKRREEELRESKAMYQDMVNNQSSGIYRIRVRKHQKWDTQVNPPYAYEFANDRYCELLGVTWSRLVTDPAMTTHLIHPDDYAEWIARNEHSGRTLEPFSWLGRMIIKSDTRWMQFESLPRELSNGDRIWTGIMRDITEIKRMEAELRLAKETAEAANKAKSQFLANMSHELRSPLNPVIGFTELLAEAPNLTDEQRTWLGIVRQRGQDLLALISDILDLSKIEAEKVVLDPRPQSLRLMLKDMIATVKPSAGRKGLTLDSHVAPELPDRVRADGLRIRQILLNLLINAVKFTSTGGVSMRVEKAGTERLARSLADGEIALRFSVSDTGIGIPPDKQAMIFETFQQADTSHAMEFGGMGLGLAIVRRLVDLMGGAVWVESEMGRGSAFFFTAIVSVIQVEPAAAAERSAPDSSHRQPLRILVVDDDPINNLMLEALLRRRGDAVRSAMDGKQALSLLSSDSFDVVLMDVKMPQMDGVEATREIRERDRRNGRRTIVIAVTAQALRGDRDIFLVEGMDGYVSKPIQQEKLFAAIDAVVEGMRGK